MHGTIMVFFGIVPSLRRLRQFRHALQIGTVDMAFPGSTSAVSSSSLSVHPHDRELTCSGGAAKSAGRVHALAALADQPDRAEWSCIS